MSRNYRVMVLQTRRPTHTTAYRDARTHPRTTKLPCSTNSLLALLVSRPWYCWPVHLSSTAALTPCSCCVALLTPFSLRCGTTDTLYPRHIQLPGTADTLYPRYTQLTGTVDTLSSATQSLSTSADKNDSNYFGRQRK